MIGARYKADKMGERVEPWLTPMFTLKEEEAKVFQEYEVEQFK